MFWILLFFIGVAVIVLIAIFTKVKEESDKVLEELREINRKERERIEELDEIHKDRD